MKACHLALTGALLALSVAAAGCGPKESIVAVGDGKKLSAEEIDADPMALLPGGAVVLWYGDAAALMASSVGPASVRFAQNLVPLTGDMNFDPKRDLRKVYGAGYSMQGADFAAVAQGDFDVAAIKAAANRGALSALGKPLQKTSYGGNDLYLTGDIGFVVLTSHSLLVGNPAGLRRALDRIRDARVKREVPDWVVELFKTPGAEVVVAGDTAGQSVASSLTQQLPFLNRVERFRVLGDFKEPGMNLAGALTYPDAQAAASSEQQMRQLNSAASWSWLAGISNPIRFFQSQVQGNDVQFAVQLDGPAFSALLDRIGGMFGGAKAR